MEKDTRKDDNRNTYVLQGDESIGDVYKRQGYNNRPLGNCRYLFRPPSAYVSQRFSFRSA